MATPIKKKVSRLLEASEQAIDYTQKKREKRSQIAMMKPVNGIQQMRGHDPREDAMEAMRKKIADLLKN